MSLGDRTPVVDAGAAERIGADADSFGADRVEVDHVRQVRNVGIEVVVALHGLQRPGQGHPFHVAQTVTQDLVRPSGDRPGGVGVGGPAVGRVVLEPAVAGRVV